MRVVYDAIVAARESIERLSAELLPPQDPRDSGCKSSEKVELNSSYESKMTAAFLRSFAENLTGEFKAQICKSFDSNFGEAGFSLAARSGVCP